MGRSGYTHFTDVAIKGETEKAFLLLIGKRSIWVPKSVIADWEDYNRGDTEAELSILDWFVEKEELEA